MLERHIEARYDHHAFSVAPLRSRDQRNEITENVSSNFYNSIPLYQSVNECLPFFLHVGSFGYSRLRITLPFQLVVVVDDSTELKQKQN